MRCHFLSDLHLETQAFPWTLPDGDVLIVAGDLCHASCLEDHRVDPHAVAQRERVLAFVASATRNFAQVLLVAGNHDHYDGVLDDTASIFRARLPGVTVLDDSFVDLDGFRFFGGTLWSDFDGRDPASMERARRGMGEYFFVRKRVSAAEFDPASAKLRPADTLAAHDRTLAALEKAAQGFAPGKTVAITHHAPSRKGLNPLHMGNGLDGGYATDLEAFAARLGIGHWFHGHTHIRRSYRRGDTNFHANCRGFDGRDPTAQAFAPDLFVDF